MMATISTQRLILRQLTRTTPQQVRWLLDPKVVRYSEQRHLNHTFSTQHRYVSSFGGRSILWGIRSAETGTEIGTLSARLDDPNNVADVGIMIGETDFWGRGYAKEAWRAACDWLLGPGCGGVRKLEAGCMENNEAMLKIIRSSGFVAEGERKLHFLFDGNPVSMVLFGRMK